MIFTECGYRNHERLKKYIHFHENQWMCISAIFTALCAYGLITLGLPETLPCRIVLGLIVIGSLKIIREIVIGDLKLLVISIFTIAENLVKAGQLIDIFQLEIKPGKITRTWNTILRLAKIPLSLIRAIAYGFYRFSATIYFFGLGLVIHVAKKSWCK